MEVVCPQKPRRWLFPQKSYCKEFLLFFKVCRKKTGFSYPPKWIHNCNTTVEFFHPGLSVNKHIVSIFLIKKILLLEKVQELFISNSDLILRWKQIQLSCNTQGCGVGRNRKTGGRKCQGTTKLGKKWNLNIFLFLLLLIHFTTWMSCLFVCFVSILIPVE